MEMTSNTTIADWANNMAPAEQRTELDRLYRTVYHGTDEAFAQWHARVTVLAHLLETREDRR